MRGLLPKLVVGLVASLGFAQDANAQFVPQLNYGGSYGRPTVSPYLNLVSGFNNSGTNYYTLVRPALQQQQINQAAQQNFAQLQRGLVQATQSSRASPTTREPIRATGHPTSFFFYGNYYPTLSRR
jgi:hypothetical protein